MARRWWIRRQNPALANTVESGLKKLHALEKERCAELDAPAEAFGSILKGAILLAPGLSAADRVAVSSLSYNLGKWIYFADAWDDREKDQKSGSYNPFLVCGADEERARFNLYYCLNEAVNAYELLDLKSNKGVLDNIMYVGCAEKTKRLLGGNHEQSL